MDPPNRPASKGRSLRPLAASQSSSLSRSCTVYRVSVARFVLHQSAVGHRVELLAVAGFAVQIGSQLAKQAGRDCIG